MDELLRLLLAASPEDLEKVKQSLTPETQAEASDTAEPEAETQPEPEQVSEPEPETQTEAEPVTEPEPETQPEPEPVSEPESQVVTEPEPVKTFGEEYRNLLLEHHKVPEGLRALLPEDVTKVEAYLASQGYKDLVAALNPAPAPAPTPSLTGRADGSTKTGPDLSKIGIAFGGV